MSSSSAGLPELTVRAIILGALDHPRLHRGQRVPRAQSRPDLRHRDSGRGDLHGGVAAVQSPNILENNIVATGRVPRARLSAIIFVLPGLVIVGWWHGFPYWLTLAAAGLGGILGVMFSVPLRRTLIIEQRAALPEGRRRGRSAEGGRQLARRQRGEPPGVGRHHRQRHRIRRVFCPEPKPSGGGRGRRLLPRRLRARPAYRRACPWRCSASGIWSAFRWEWRCSPASSSAWGILRARSDRGAAGGRLRAAHRRSGYFAPIFDSSARACIGVAAVWTFSRILGPIVGGPARGNGRIRGAGCARPAAAGRARSCRSRSSAPSSLHRWL